MQLNLALDNPSSFYTNLDFVSGKVFLTLNGDENVSAITVKLEGESNTMLLRPVPQYERHRHHHRRDDMAGPAHEYHKILYRTEQVFPPQQHITGRQSSQSYTLPAGVHQYQFRLKIPFNNSCASHTQNMNFPFGGFMAFPSPGQLLYHHKTNTLPPSLTGFPNQAEIRYYVKVTVKRPSFLKENRRTQVGFKFLPIEPPRAPPSQAEAFARRSHDFGAVSAQGMFRRRSNPPPGRLPAVRVDARLPLLKDEPAAILTCNEPMPLRILVQKQAESPEQVFLVSFQISLIGETQVRAQEVYRMETRPWVVASQHNLAIPISDPADQVGTEKPISSNLWDQIPLPRTVTPSFDICNLTRTYTLEVSLVIGYGRPGRINPQVQTLPLRLPVQVYSGIAPPAALLEAMASHGRPNLPQRPAAAVTSPAAGVSSPAFDPLYPPQLGSTGAPLANEFPPSYEDAMADEVGPLDGPRRDWSGVTNENAPSEVGAGSKRNG